MVAGREGMLEFPAHSAPGNPKGSFRHDVNGIRLEGFEALQDLAAGKQSELDFAIGRQGDGPETIRGRNHFKLVSHRFAFGDHPFHRAHNAVHLGVQASVMIMIFFGSRLVIWVVVFESEGNLREEWRRVKVRDD